MPIENNIELGSGQIYFKGLDEAFDISDVEGEIEFADDKEYVKINAVKDLMEATIECEPMEINREWTLAYCRICRQPIPIIMFDALTLGTEGWTCPLCTTIARIKRRMVKDCCSEIR